VHRSQEGGSQLWVSKRGGLLDYNVAEILGEHIIIALPRDREGAL